MFPHVVALFGEAEKGDFQTAYYCKSIAQLADYLGEPPSEESRGLQYAIQALMYERNVIYFRVHEEGFSIPDYMKGLDILKNKELIPHVSALCLPGVGDNEIIEATHSICSLHRSFLIINEKDFYDYLTAR